MTDPDRGAYAPHDDEPLSFDARRPSDRRPVPMTLIGSAIVLVALIGGVALVYRGGVRHAGEGPRPVGEPVMSVKTAAAPPPMREESGEPGGYSQAKPATTVTQSATTSTETTTSTNGVANSAAPPTFAAAPEQPGPRPAPQPHSLALTAKPPVANVNRPPVVPASPVSGAPDDTEVAAAGATVRSQHGASVKDQAPLKLADATPFRRGVRERASAEDNEDNLAMARLVARSTAADRVRSAGTAAETRLASTAGGAVVQIGAFSSAELAARGYADVASDMSGRMAGKSKHVLPLEVNGKTLYRTWLSGFASRSDAVAFCETLRTKNKSCIVKG